MIKNKHKKNKQLVSDFNKKFSTTLELDQIQSMLGSVFVAPWYKEWKKKWAQQLSLPEQFREVGFTEKQWATIITQEQLASTSRAEIQRKRDKLAKEYKQAIAKIAKEEKDVIKNATGWLVAIKNLNVEQLTFSNQVTLSKTELKNKNTVGQELITKTQKDLLVQGEQATKDYFKALGIEIG
jgi:hypothetical protein